MTPSLRDPQPDFAVDTVRHSYAKTEMEAAVTVQTTSNLPGLVLFDKQKYANVRYEFTQFQRHLSNAFGEALRKFISYAMSESANAKDPSDDLAHEEYTRGISGVVRNLEPVEAERLCMYLYWLFVSPEYWTQVKADAIDQARAEYEPALSNAEGDDADDSRDPWLDERYEIVEEALHRACDRANSEIVTIGRISTEAQSINGHLTINTTEESLEELIEDEKVKKLMYGRYKRTTRGR